MASPSTKKSDASLAVPAWHPNLRIAAQLPDTKVVRTAFFINGFAILVAIMITLYFGYGEWKLYEVNKQIAVWQHDIDRDKVQSEKAVALYNDFKTEEAKTSEVADFVASKPIVSELMLRLSQVTPKRIAFDMLSFRENGINLRATVKGAPDRASGDASAYEKQLRTDKKIGPMFASVNLLTMKRNGTNGRLVIEIFCEYKKAAPKKT
jgi:hypothetical protein